MIPDRILSKSSGSAVHSCWHSPVQGGIATSVEHMLFVETPESMSFFIFFQSPAFQATRLFKPSVCGWSNSHESFYHPQYIKLPLLHTPFLRGHICVYLVKLLLFVWMNIIHPSHTSVKNYKNGKQVKAIFKEFIVWLKLQRQVPRKVLVCVGGTLLQKVVIICE